MPTDLDQLAQDADHQDRWGTPRWNDSLQQLAMADTPPEVPPSGSFPPGHTPPSRFLEMFPQPGQQSGGAPRVPPPPPLGSTARAPAPPLLRVPTPPPLPPAPHPLGGNPRAQDFFSKTLGKSTTPEDFAQNYFAGYHNPQNIQMSYERSEYGSRHSHLIFNGDLTRNGEKIGEITRTIYPNNFNAEHDWLTLRDDLQGTNIAKQIIRNQFHFYDDFGTQKVGITAVNTGSYAWLKYGWLPNKYSFPRLQENLKKRFEDPQINRVLNDSERSIIRAALASNDPRSIWDISDLSRKFNVPGANRPWSLGKIFFNQNTWSGEFDVNNTSQRDRLDAYTKPKP